MAAIVVYGGIMNLSSVTMFASTWNREVVAAAYLSGIWFDLIHAAATVFFLFILSRPMLEKLERVKSKYGMIEP